MATKRWRGDAPAVAMVATVEITAYDTATTYILTINGKTVSQVGTGGTVTTTAAAFVTAWNALSATSYPEHSEITASSSSGVITLTADTAGKPFTCTSSKSGGAGTIGSVTTTTTNSGPNDWNVAGNWSASGVPTSSDDVYIENSSVNIRYNLDQSSVTLTSLHILASFTGQLGLPEHTGAYFEYRDTYLKISATTINIGQGIGTGSGFIKINSGATANGATTTVNVYGTSSSVTPGLEAFLWKGTVTGTGTNTVNLYKGSFGAAVIGGETATVNTLRVGYVSSIQGDVTSRFGSGVSFPSSSTISLSGGNVTINSAAITITETDGILTIGGSATVTTYHLDGGTCYYRSTGILTTVNVGNEAQLLFTQDMQARTVTTCNVFAGATIRDPFKTVTWTNGIDLERCSLADVTLDVGTHVKLSMSTPS